MIREQRVVELFQLQKDIPGNNGILETLLGFPGGSDNNLPEMQVQSLGGEDSLEEKMATHYSILACRIPWTEEPCGLQSMGSQRVGHS